MLRWWPSSAIGCEQENDGKIPCASYQGAALVPRKRGTHVHITVYCVRALSPFLDQGAAAFLPRRIGAGRGAIEFVLVLCTRVRSHAAPWNNLLLCTYPKN